MRIIYLGTAFLIKFTLANSHDDYTNVANLLKFKCGAYPTFNSC